MLKKIALAALSVVAVQTTVFVLAATRLTAFVGPDGIRHSFPYPPAFFAGQLVCFLWLHLEIKYLNDDKWAPGEAFAMMFGAPWVIMLPSSILGDTIVNLLR